MLAVSQYSNLRNLDYDVAWRGYYLVAWMQHFGGAIRVSEGLRSAERQAELYARGRTVPGAIVTRVKTSRHQIGRAFDIDFIGMAPDTVPLAWWDFAGRLGEALGLRWGGRWSDPRDYRHFEA